MIRLTRINHEPLILNSDLIEIIETTPDTVLTLTTSQKIVVLESPDDIVEQIVQFRRRIAPQREPHGKLSEGRGHE